MDRPEMGRGTLPGPEGWGRGGHAGTEDQPRTKACVADLRRALQRQGHTSLLLTTSEVGNWPHRGHDCTPSHRITQRISDGPVARWDCPRMPSPMEVLSWPWEGPTFETGRALEDVPAWGPQPFPHQRAL